jgi:hypothetical protein
MLVGVLAADALLLRETPTLLEKEEEYKEVLERTTSSTFLTLIHSTVSVVFFNYSKLHTLVSMA